MPLRSYVAKAVRDIYVNRLIMSSIVPGRLRPRLLSRVGHDIDPTVSMNPGQFIGATTNLRIGPGANINEGCFFDLGATTTIGAGAGLSYQTMVITCTHEVGDRSRRWGTPRAAPVVIGNGCWIGARVIILPGVTIGDGCVVAAGSIVTSDCEPNSVYAGTPARLIRRLSDD